MELRKKIDIILGIMLIVLMAFMTITVLWQVGSRYINQLANIYTSGLFHDILVFIGKTSSFTDELARYQLIWVGLLGASYVAGKGQHLAIDIIHTKMSENNLKALSLIINGLIGAFALTVMIVGGFHLMLMSFFTEQTSSAIQLPLGYVYIVQPLSGIMILYYSLDNILRQRKRTAKTPLK